MTKEEKIEKYYPLYIGQWLIWSMDKAYQKPKMLTIRDMSRLIEDSMCGFWRISLRKISSLTDEEKYRLFDIRLGFDMNDIKSYKIINVDEWIGYNLWRPEQTAYLLELGIDLFDLIEDKLAVEVPPQIT